MILNDKFLIILYELTVSKTGFGVVVKFQYGNQIAPIALF